MPEPPETYAGQRLGLPAAGAGSLAPWRARLTGLVLDWAASLLLTAVIFGPATLRARDVTSTLSTPLIFFVITTTMITLTGSSLGQLACRIGVARLDRQPVGLGRAVVRQLMTTLVVPALVIDGQRRGLQDLALGTIVVNRRTRGTT